MLAATGCFTPVQWRESQVGPVPFEDVWTAFQEFAETDGFPIDRAGSDRGRKSFVSMWRSRELPFRRSNRRRVHATFERLDEGGWLVRYYVEQQTVGDIARSFEPREEDWDDAGQDSEMEQRLAVKLNLRFPNGEVQPMPTSP